jgi:hypothetical protein
MYSYDGKFTVVTCNLKKFREVTMVPVQMLVHPRHEVQVQGKDCKLQVVS